MTARPPLRLPTLSPSPSPRSGLLLALFLSLPLLLLGRALLNEPLPGPPTPQRLASTSPAPIQTEPGLADPGDSGSDPRLTTQDLDEHEMPKLPDTLSRALSQARENCTKAARLSETSSAWSPFEVDAILLALRGSPFQESSYGELPQIEEELHWLATLRGPADLAERSVEDLRFLIGALHWYLETGLQVSPDDAEHLKPGARYDLARLREFAGLDYSDLLAQWD